MTIDHQQPSCQWTQVSIPHCLLGPHDPLLMSFWVISLPERTVFPSPSCALSCCQSLWDHIGLSECQGPLCPVQSSCNNEKWGLYVPWDVQVLGVRASGSWMRDYSSLPPPPPPGCCIPASGALCSCTARVIHPPSPHPPRQPGPRIVPHTES